VRVVVDTNVMVSALFLASSLPARLIELWRIGRFDVLISAEQLDELMRVTRYLKVRERLTPALAGRLINELRDLAIMVTNLPTVSVSPDPSDNFLLAVAAAGAADFLVTGDKAHVLSLKAYQRTKILSVREFLTLHKSLP
jgi:putative PIN family toxin of toxin-antitoxin system